jgi:hypothetical protein
MKRYGNLWAQITDFANLLQASRQAQRGKRFRDNVLDFNYHFNNFSSLSSIKLTDLGLIKPSRFLTPSRD